MVSLATDHPAGRVIAGMAMRGELCPTRRRARRGERRRGSQKRDVCRGPGEEGFAGAGRGRQED